MAARSSQLSSSSCAALDGSVICFGRGREDDACDLLAVCWLADAVLLLVLLVGLGATREKRFFVAVLDGAAGTVLVAAGGVLEELTAEPGKTLRCGSGDWSGEDGESPFARPELLKAMTRGGGATVWAPRRNPDTLPSGVRCSRMSEAGPSPASVNATTWKRYSVSL